MRTKSLKSEPNGTPNARTSTDPPPSDPRPPINPQDLSDADKQQLRAYLDKNEKPFSILTVPPSNAKKRKRDSSLQTQNDIFDERLTVQYEVRPSNNWESLRRYKKFTVGSESIATGECILVKHDDSEEARLNIPEQWKAKVLEVRALDPEHVYIRVAWLNRPEDLDSGRKPYHGRNELIPTNQMDVIDAMSVNGRFEISQWDEHEDTKEIHFEDQFYWRQTYDFAKTKTLSSLRHICIDNQPQNPDELIIQCAKVDCRKWLHVKCIAEQAVLHAGDDSADGVKPNGTKTSKKGKAQSLSIPPGSMVQAKAFKEPYTAEVYVSGLPNGPEQTSAEKTQVKITDAEGGSRLLSVHCLFCKQEIE